MLNFENIRLNINKKPAPVELEEISKKDIAIIGAAIKLPMANTLEEYWNNLRNGIDCVRSIPDSRKRDADDILSQMDIDVSTVKYAEAAYLDEIDRFDYSFFKLAPKEACLMDPNQRLFLETAWNAVEDSGYGGTKLVGSRTGVYVGYGSDPDYKRLISSAEPEAASFALTGNVRPIIASRLSYLMDFRGPSLLVDTTCSSSLMAVHLALRGIRNGECELAIAGGVQVHILPVRQTKIGIESSDGRAKTFDDGSDGTGTGEGVIAIVLKSLSKALEDGDNIYAVIKGSAANHDGASIGLTAPNAEAQEDVIVRAWKESGIDPSTISYIEAHGTGTKLGDPIEIDGIQRAFRRFTGRKSFCAVGSVKSNIGHLDNTAGIAGLLKAVLALENKQIPPTLHFKYPNRKINFEESPVYVNNKLSDWNTEGFPRRCGVSAFGLSGTNVHIILEEAPLRSKEEYVTEAALNVFTLSAKSKAVLREMADNYTKFLEKNKGLNIKDICYTANTGRGHYGFRLAVLAKDNYELLERLRELSVSEFDYISNRRIFYGEHKLAPVNKEVLGEGEVTEAVVKETSIAAESKIRDFLSSAKESEDLIVEICKAYVKGAEINWEEFYKGRKYKRISLPSYAFEKKRCWVEAKGSSKRKVDYARDVQWSLLDNQVAESMGVDIYSTSFSVDSHWVLNEHRIMGDCVLVGTAYLEMAIQACHKHFQGAFVEFRDIVFVKPLVVREGEYKDVQTIITSRNGFYEFTVVSNGGFDDLGQVIWVRHVEGKILGCHERDIKAVDISEIRDRNREGYFIPDIDSYNADSVFEFGPRWKNIREMYIGDGELLSHIKMPDMFTGELMDYVLYPSLMDNAIATMPLLDKLLKNSPFSGENGIFLPFSYKRLRILRSLPAEFYSYVKLKGDISDGSESVTFDIVLLDKSGEAFAEIEEYTLKKAKKNQMPQSKAGTSDIYYEVAWIPQDITVREKDIKKGKILIFADEKGMADNLASKLKTAQTEVAMVNFGCEYFKISDEKYIISSKERDYKRLFSEIDLKDIAHIIHMSSILGNSEIKDVNELERSQDMGVRSLFHIVRELLGIGTTNKVNVYLISQYANRVTGKEKRINPENATLFGLGKVIEQEYPNLSLRCIDIDLETSINEIFKEISAYLPSNLVAYRAGKRYVEEFRRLEIGQILRQDVSIKDNGVYLITGGLGGIGLETGKYIASKNRANIALISRSELPPGEEWEKILRDGTDSMLCHKIKAIKEIEGMGSRVTCISADVSNEEEIAAAVNGLRQVYGRIRGVIHSAGLAGDGFIIKKNQEEFDMVLSPKVRGTWLLDMLTRQDKPDFFIMFSSNNTLMGVPGQGDYTAANSYLCAFSDYRNIRGERTLAINWPAWKETGMAVNHGVNFDSIFKAMPTKQALDAFDLAIGLNVNRVIIGELNVGGSIHGKTIYDAKISLSEQIKSRIDRKNESTPVKKGLNEKVKDIKVALKGKKTGDFTEEEKIMAGIWKEVLGFEEFDIYEDFFDIGGDSILITKVQALAEERFPGRISVSDLFSYRTISDLAKHLSKEQDKLKEQHYIDIKPMSSSSDMDKGINELLDAIHKGDIDIDKAVESYKSMGV